MELVTGRPQDKRIDKEERVYDLLDQLNIDYQRLDPVSYTHLTLPTILLV